MAKAEYRSAIRSRKLINSALADLLLEKPLDKITVSDVVRKAELNRGTFYAHYADIPDVLNNLIQQTFSTIRDAIDEQPIVPEVLPALLLRRVQMILEEDLDFYRKIMSSNVSVLLREQLVNTVLDYLMQNDKRFGIDRTKYAMAMRFCAGGLSSLYCDWFLGKVPCTLDELTEYGENMLIGIIVDMENESKASE